MSCVEEAKKNAQSEVRHFAFRNAFSVTFHFVRCRRRLYSWSSVGLPLFLNHLYLNQGIGMPQWFNAIDVDHSGELDPGELQQALALGNLHFSLAVVAHMIRLELKVTCVRFCVGRTSRGKNVLSKSCGLCQWVLHVKDRCKHAVA